jgi:hypothetical protein
MALLFCPLLGGLSSPLCIQVQFGPRQKQIQSISRFTDAPRHKRDERRAAAVVRFVHAAATIN